MANSYYTGNGIYDYLLKNADQNSFFWTGGNMWLLIYGNSSGEPEVVSIVSGKNLNEEISDEEKHSVQIAASITKNTGISVNFIRFQPDMKIQNVLYWQQGQKNISLESSVSLKEKFLNLGLKMNEMRAQKSINSKSSSPYHEWQRDNMGSEVVVADIDLMRTDQGELSEIIELKRSYIPIERWESYEDDYSNFMLLSRLAYKRGLKFYIVYNHRRKDPFYDDISKLKVFEFNHTKSPHCKLLGYSTIQQFSGNKFSNICSNSCSNIYSNTRMGR